MRLFCLLDLRWSYSAGEPLRRTTACFRFVQLHRVTVDDLEQKFGRSTVETEEKITDDGLRDLNKGTEG
ncbi:hypothetical protein Baya_16738 [Bagarius yarrelli]|uniref:Uncharacterized protein n=1 Tax=Bagarius yarrelli TaxID=175774 RepID=A0A556VWM2_BAGYA|nr:hypothetical protein Baya_16738 [Bagarius yarrelli]